MRLYIFYLSENIMNGITSASIGAAYNVNPQSQEFLNAQQQIGMEVTRHILASSLLAQALESLQSSANKFC
ncbi:hypothetical protein AB833_24560 [Chromatiales bacterium (ex Bugula neritina AB1)]|nr:hypothetical protein AB833_24560 [Chromatiales bacterium (ex Bugula neritina AB1)]